MPEHRAEDNAHVAAEDTPRRAVRRPRRATTPPPAGSDPTPTPEPSRHSGTENDEQLKRDKPPHWG